ncbi:MAG: hypothetical protein EXR66_04500 [Dehalococcoidia bacterium]|nr:hypothetical protein [Dehalococcoidia bacterium]
MRTLLEPGERAVTGQLDFRWLRPYTGDVLRAVGLVSRRGSSLTHCTVEFVDEREVVVGTGSATFIVLARDANA